jgi:arsenical pump membrane protein
MSRRGRTAPTSRRAAGTAAWPIGSALMTSRRLGPAPLPALAIAVAGLATRPLGPLAGTMLLVVTLPPLAASLDALGWVSIVVERIREARLSTTRELVAAYATWLAISATLTLDLAAVVAVPVGLRLAAGQDKRSSRNQLGAAILGSNVGSLLFAFSNLTNLILVSATGISFAAYLAAALVPQLLAAVGVGALLVYRTRRRAAGPSSSLELAMPAGFDSNTPERATRLTLVGGAIAAVGALSAVVVGLAGGDVAPVFAIATAIVAGCAIASERQGTRPRDLARSIPPAGIAIVALAAIAIGPMADLADFIPNPQTAMPQIVALPMIALVGGLLAATVNNLPAAAFGAFWLVGASPAAIVAFLIGTNLIAIGPHGSLATILCQRQAARKGVRVGARMYLGSGGATPQLLDCQPLRRCSSLARATVVRQMLAQHPWGVHASEPRM